MFSKGEAIKFGWEKTKANFGLLTGALAVSLLINLIPYGMQQLIKGSHPVLSFLISMSGVILQMIVAIGLIGICLKVADNKESRLSDLVENPHLFFRYLLASILYALIVVGGLILLVVPGVIWAIKYQFYSYAIVDRNTGIRESLRISSRITKGHRWNLFLFGLLLILINIAGACALLIGLLATIPLSMIAITHVYRKLSQQNEAPAVTPQILTDGQGI